MNIHDPIHTGHFDLLLGPQRPTKATIKDFVEMRDDVAIFKTDMLIREPERRFGWQFFSTDHWTFALPVQSMYLVTRERALDRMKYWENYAKHNPEYQPCVQRLVEFINI